MVGSKGEKPLQPTIERLQPLDAPFRIARKAAVVIFVRHRPNCEKAHFGPYHRGCDCPKFFRYSVGGKQKKVKANTRSWTTAEANAKELEVRLNSGTSSGTPASPAKTHQQTILQAVETFVRGKESENVTASTVRKLRHQLGLFEQFMASRSKFYPSDITPQDVIDFRASWKWGDMTRIKAQGNLRGFIRFCCKGDQRVELLDALGTIKESREGKQRRKPKPLSETEVKKLLAQVPTTFKGEAHKIPRVTAFIKCGVSTGLACVDLVHLERRALESVKNGVLEIERRKTGRKALPRIDEKLREELLQLAGKDKKFVFIDGDSLPHSATTFWQYEMRQLFEDAGLWIKGDLVHRFRDTMVDHALGLGYSLTDVASMLGDTLQVVERHYSDLASNRMAERLATLPARKW